MKTFQIHQPSHIVSEVYRIEAESEEEALKKFASGEHECLFEEFDSVDDDETLIFELSQETDVLEEEVKREKHS